MKKTFALMASFLFVGIAQAQFDEPINLPQVDYSVLNISQDNVDATANAAHPGDILRFEMTISSNEDVLDFVPQVNLTDLTVGAALTDTGLGVEQGSDLVFPAITNALGPINEKYVFFARVNEQCGGVNSLVSQAADGGEVLVALENCNQEGGEGSCYGPNGCDDVCTGPNCGLTKTGPNTVIALMSVLGVLFLGFVLRRRMSS